MQHSLQENVLCIIIHHLLKLECYHVYVQDMCKCISAYCVCVSVCVCHSLYLETKEQPLEVCFLLPTWVLGIKLRLSACFTR